jgi:hypothetical protein
MEAAVGIAHEVLLWLTGEPDAMADFLALSGLDVDDLRVRVNDPEVLGGLLDHLLSSDTALIRAAAEIGIDPADIARARAALPGGDTPHWT